MKKAELFFAVIILIGFIFRLMHWPFANILISIPFLLLSLLYMFFSFGLLNNLGLRSAFKGSSYKNISTLRLIAAIGTGFILSALVIYIMFVLQFWPYGRMGLSIMLPMLIIVIVIALLCYFIKRKHNKYSALFYVYGSTRRFVLWKRSRIC